MALEAQVGLESRLGLATGPLGPRLHFGLLPPLRCGTVDPPCCAVGRISGDVAWAALSLALGLH